MSSPGEPQEPQPASQQQEASQAPGPVRRYWLWVALSCAVAVAAVAFVNIPGNSNTLAPLGVQLTTPGGAASPVGASAATPHPGATEPVPVAVPVPSPSGLGAVSHLPRKLAAALAKWDAGIGGAGLTVVLNNLGNATQNDGLKLYAAMRTACLTVSTAVTAARASPPIPDAAMQTWYARGLTSLAKAAVDCRAGISAQAKGEESVQTEETPAVLHRSESEFATGAKELYRATAKIKALKNS